MDKSDEDVLDEEEDWMFRTFEKSGAPTSTGGHNALKSTSGASNSGIMMGANTGISKGMDPFTEDCNESFEEPSLKLPG